MSKLNIILSPHFDDAALSLGGFLAQKGSESLVATFCAGRPDKAVSKPWDSQSGFRDSDEAMDSRTEENRISLAYLHVPEQNVLNYDCLDSQYQSLLSLATNREYKKIKGFILKLFNQYAGTATAFFAPGMEKHRDHQNVKLAFLECVQEQKKENFTFYLYQDVPYADDFLNNRSLERVITMSGLERLQTLIAGTLAVEQVIISLSEIDIEKKIEAVKMYKSQIAPLKDFSNVDMPSVVKNFAANQAKALGATTPYCEVVYKLKN